MDQEEKGEIDVKHEEKSENEVLLVKGYETEELVVSGSLAIQGVLVDKEQSDQFYQVFDVRIAKNEDVRIAMNGTLTAKQNDMIFVSILDNDSRKYNSQFENSWKMRPLPWRDKFIQSSFLSVEFDIKYNKILGDTNENYVSVDLNSVLGVTSGDCLSKGIDVKGGRKMTVWIEYNDHEKMICVWVGYSESLKPLSPLLVCRIDISKSFKEFLHVGFVASNGRDYDIHSVDEWKFWTSGFMSSTMLVDTVTEELEECLICFPGKSSSTAACNDGSDHLRRRNRVLGLVLGLGGKVLIVRVVIGFLCLRKRKRVVVKRKLYIVIHIASALIYLHEECKKQISHRDWKTCNVMLDAEFNDQLGDFGLAEVYECSCKARDATLLAGTRGYLAPEYLYSGIPSVKTVVHPQFAVIS